MFSMKTQFLVSGLLAVLFFGYSKSATDCYNCYPEDRNCDDPSARGRPTDLCSSIIDDDLPSGRVLQQQRSRLRANETEYVCVSLKIVNNVEKNKTGIYRTCLVANTTDNGCQILSTEFKDDKYGDVVLCKICNENNCNNQTDSSITNAGINLKFTSILFYTTFSFLFVTSIINM